LVMVTGRISGSASSSRRRYRRWVALIVFIVSPIWMVGVALMAGC